MSHIPTCIISKYNIRYLTTIQMSYINLYTTSREMLHHNICYIYVGILDHADKHPLGKSLLRPRRNKQDISHLPTEPKYNISLYILYLSEVFTSSLCGQSFIL